MSRKVTWTVEIDASQAEAQARKIREIFTRALADIAPAQSTGANAGPAAALSAATEEAKELKAALGEVAKTNPAASLEEMKRAAEDAQRRVSQLRDEYEKLTATAGAYDRSSAATRARFNDHVQNVARTAGEEDAARVRRMGTSVNIGQRNAEHAADTYDYAAAERDHFQRQEKNVTKQRYNAEERVQVAQLYAALNEAEHAALMMQKQAAQAQMQAFENFDWDNASESEVDDIIRAAAEADATLKQIAEEETDLLKAVKQANEKAARVAKEEQDKIARSAAKQAGEIHVKGAAAAPVVAAGPTQYTQQTAITVSKASVDNAAALANELREAAAAAKELAAVRFNQAATGQQFDIETARQVAAIQKQAKIEAEEATAAIRAKAAAEKEAATAAAAAAKQASAAEKERTSTAHAGTTARTKEARAEAAAVIAAYKQELAAQQKTEKEKTDALRREADTRLRVVLNALRRQEQEEKRAAREAEKARKQAATAAEAQQKKMLALPFGMSGSGMLSGLMGMAGLYSLSQIPGQAYDAGKTGAMQARQAETFSGLAERLDLDGNAIIAAVKRASNETISDMDAMSLSAQLMAGKYAQGRSSIVGDIGIMVEASRAFSKVFTDEQGQFLTTQEVYARLVKYIREGNKELVDQFGLSNARIAQALGVSVDGMASAQGAALRLDGLIKVLKEDLDRLPKSAADGAGAVADALEQAETRTKQAEERRDRALSRPAAAWAGFTADVAENMFVMSPEYMQYALQNQRRNMDTRVAIDTMLNLPGMGGKQYKEQSDALTQLSATIRLVELAQKSGLVGAEQYAAALQDMITTADQTGEYTQRDIDLMIEIAKWFANASAAAAGLTGSVGQIGPAMASAISPTAGLIDQLMILKGIGNIPLTIATDILDRGTIGALGGVANMGKLQSSPWAAPPGTPTGEYLRAFGPRDDLGKLSPGQQAANQAELQGIYDIRRVREQEEKAAASKAASEWKSASDKAASAFEQAAKDSANAFKSKIDAIPGLTGGLSEVTQTQIDLAKAGVPQNFADDYRRRLEDEIAQKKDLYPDVSIEDARARAGIDPRVPDALVGQVFSQKWESGELFANPKNLEIINLAAAQSAMASNDAGAKGKQNIYSYLGLDVANSPLDPAGKDAFAEMIGLGDDDAKQAGTAARQKFSEAFYSPAASGGGDAAGSGGSFAATIVSEIKTATSEGKLAQELSEVGAGMVGAIYSGFVIAAQNQSWGAPIIESLAAEVAPEVFTMLQEQFN